MPGAQKDITQFFSPKAKENQSKVCNKVESEQSGDKPMKDSAEVNEKEVSMETPTKKLKLENTASSNLSPDQKERMATNKLLAQIKVTARKFPGSLHSNIGPSWFKALEEEFKKPYFQKLSDFVAKERQSATKIFPPEDQVSKFYTFILFVTPDTFGTDRKLYVLIQILREMNMNNIFAKCVTHTV